MALPRAEMLQILLVAYVPMMLMAHFGLPASILHLYTLYPLPIIVTSFALPMIALVYTAPESPTRLAAVLFVATSCVGYHQTAQHIMPDRAAASGLSGPFVLLFLAATNALLLQRLYLTKEGKERSAVQDRVKNGKIGESDSSGRSSSRGIGPWAPWRWAARVIFSYRDIGTKRQAKTVPAWGPRGHKDVPSRARFLLTRGLASFGAYLVVDFLNQQPPPPEDVFSAAKSSLFPPSAVLDREMATNRIFSTVLFWFALRMTIGFIYNFTSFIGVATFLTIPADWPPYFGSPKEAYTLRKFWAVFWHSGLRNPLTNTAGFFVHSVFRIPRGTLLGRYLHIFITFFMSGTMHICLDVMAGIPIEESNARTLFIMQGVGIMIEDFAEWIYGIASKERTSAEQKGVSSWTWQRALGYVWVLLFLAWTTPSWSYANFRHQGDQQVPFSFVEWIREIRA